MDLGNMNLVKDKVDLTPKFEALEQITDQNYFMKQLEGMTAPEAVEERQQQARDCHYRRRGERPPGKSTAVAVLGAAGPTRTRPHHSQENP